MVEIQVMYLMHIIMFADVHHQTFENETGFKHFESLVLHQRFLAVVGTHSQI